MRSHGFNIAGLLLGCILFSCGADIQPQNTIVPDTALISVSGTANYNYGVALVGGTKATSFTVNNFGLGSATELSSEFGLSLHFGFTGGAFPGTTGTCTNELLPNSSCTVDVQFNPQSSGSFQSALNLTYFDGVAIRSAAFVKLTGQGVESISD